MWSQEQLGERAGVDRKTINRIENGSSNPRYDLVVDLARALDMPVEWLVREPHRFEEDTGADH